MWKLDQKVLIPDYCAEFTYVNISIDPTKQDKSVKQFRYVCRFLFAFHQIPVFCMFHDVDLPQAEPVDGNRYVVPKCEACKNSELKAVKLVKVQ